MTMRTLVVGLALCGALSACNTIIYDRSEAARRSSIELCRLYVHYFQPKTIVDELNLRISRGEFTIQQCREAGDAEEKRQIAAASGAAAGTAYQLGYAIGSRGRVMSTNPPTPAPEPPKPAAFVPYAPIPLAHYLTTQNVDRAGTTKVCAYGGTSTVIIMNPYETCPAMVPR